MRVPAWSILVVLAFVGAARADVMYVSQTRYIYAEASVAHGPPLQQARLDASDFGVFNESLDLHYPAPGNEVEIAHVDQTSTLAPDGISFAWLANAMGTPPSQGWGTPRCQSVLDVTFDVTEPQSFRLSGVIHFPFNGGGSFLLSGPGVSIGQDPIRYGVPPFNFIVDQAGVLAPGRYRLLVSADAYVIDGSPWASHVSGNGMLQFPCPSTGSAIFVLSATTLVRRRRTPSSLAR
jgi:hypothetical protein